MMYGIENKIGYYMIGDYKFPNVHVTAEFALSTLKDAGFSDLILDKYSPSDDPNRVYRFIKGTRNRNSNYMNKSLNHNSLSCEQL